MMLNSRGYKIMLSEERDGDDVAWVAEVPELPGCYCAEDSPEEAIAHVEQSITDWLVSASRDGRPIPQPASLSSGTFTI
jgi:predicted RNase H-like HicB family nuclease